MLLGNNIFVFVLACHEVIYYIFCNCGISYDIARLLRATNVNNRDHELWYVSKAATKVLRRRPPLYLDNEVITRHTTYLIMAVIDRKMGELWNYRLVFIFNSKTFYRSSWRWHNIYVNLYVHITRLCSR